MAHNFDRPDVDQFLDEIDHEQFEEWANFFAIEPTGWQAERIVASRLSFILAQTHSTKRLREELFDIVMRHSGRSPDVESARWEAAAIRSEIEHGQTN